MTNMELQAIRMHAEAITSEGRYQIRNSKGIVVAFDLTYVRAKDWSKSYPGSTVELMS